MTRVKICGLTRDSDLETAVEAEADAVGFVCDVPVETPRQVSVDRAAALLEATPPFVTSVLVTMPADPERAIQLVDQLEPDAVQIHGGLSAGDLAYVRANVDARLLYAVDAVDPTSASTYDELVDGLVVDTVDEDGGGGTGETHDWERTKRAVTELDSPVILAGGLTPMNVADAIRTVEPFAVDVSSGVESVGGRKDEDAVRSFVRRATAAGRSIEPNHH